MLGQLPVDIGDRVSGGMAGPGNVLIRRKDRDIRLGAAFDGHETCVPFPALHLRNQPFLQVDRFGDRGGEADGAEARRKAA